VLPLCSLEDEREREMGEGGGDREVMRKGREGRWGKGVREGGGMERRYTQKEVGTFWLSRRTLWCQTTQCQICSPYSHIHPYTTTLITRTHPNHTHTPHMPSYTVRTPHNHTTHTLCNHTYNIHAHAVHIHAPHPPHTHASPPPHTHASSHTHTCTCRSRRTHTKSSLVTNNVACNLKENIK